MSIRMWLSKMVQFVADSILIRADKVRIGSFLIRSHSCLQIGIRAHKFVNILYTGVCIEIYMVEDESKIVSFRFTAE